ncbi:hypothetical protein BKI52_34335 [marine bacterium AO1-C]|nr:hypothetical protein BKI52_34335 [marine bacterium AO1-C]
MVNRVKLVIRGGFLLGWLLLQWTVLSLAQAPSSSWKSVQASKKGSVEVYYVENEPFIYRTGNTLAGIEKELLDTWVAFVKTKYQVDITLRFRPLANTQSVYEKIKKSQKNEPILGISSLAITPERLNDVTFTTPYCPEIAVLVSNSAVPGIQNSEELKKILADFTVLYTRNERFEEYLSEIRKRLPQVKSSMVNNAQEILKRIDTGIDNFGYTALPQYLAGRQKGLRIKRQNLLKITHEGYAMMLPLGSDWKQPLEAFYKSEAFKAKLPVILKKYLGQNIDELLTKINANIGQEGNENVQVIKQQLKDLESQQKDGEQRRNQLYINIFIVGFVLAAIILLLLYRNNLQKQKSNLLLRQQKEEIEEQKNDLAEKNEQILQQKEEIAQQRDDVITKNIEIEKRRNELKKLNQVKDRLFSIISHDLRSPLNSLKGTLALMEMGVLEKDELIHFSSELNKELSYVLELMQNLLEWAKAQMEGMEAVIKLIDIHELVKNNVGLLSPVAEKKNVQIISEVPEETKAYGDEEMIKLVIRNLISNAIKFTSDAGKIQIHTKTQANELEVSIIDDGVGMSPEKTARLFNADTHFTTKGTNSEKGTGLGLLICKEFVEKNNGRIWVESIQGQGSVFRFTLKLND